MRFVATLYGTYFMNGVNRSSILALVGAFIAGGLLVWQAADWRGRVADDDGVRDGGVRAFWRTSTGNDSPQKHVSRTILRSPVN